jgi:hypothetical protein
MIGFSPAIETDLGSFNVVLCYDLTLTHILNPLYTNQRSHEEKYGL